MPPFSFHNFILSKMRQHKKEERTIELEIANPESQFYCFLFDFVQFLIAFVSANEEIFHRDVNTKWSNVFKVPCTVPGV